MNTCKKSSFVEPIRFESRRHHAGDAAVLGAWLGWLLGLCSGVGVLGLPQLGFGVAKGPLLTAFVTNIVGILTGALVGWLIGWMLWKDDTRPS